MILPTGCRGSNGARALLQHLSTCSFQRSSSLSEVLPRQLLSLDLYLLLLSCLVIGCQCPTTPPVVVEGAQSLQRALMMGVVGAGGPGQVAPVCFRGVGTDSQACVVLVLGGIELVGTDQQPADHHDGEQAQQQLRGPRHRISQPARPTGCLPTVTNARAPVTLTE